MGQNVADGEGAGAIATTKVGRNDPCPCGSGRKFKHCCDGKNPRADFPAGLAEESPGRRGRRLRTLSLAGRRHFEAGNWSEANSIYREIVALCPDSGPAYCDLGITFVRLGRMTEAVAALQRAVELRPGQFNALVNLAYALEFEGRQAEAVSAYRKASRRADNDIERSEYSAKALAMEDKLEEAETQLRRLLAIAPKRSSARSLLGRVLSQRGMIEEAAQQLAKAVEDEPSALQQMTTVKRMTEADRPLLDRMRILAERPGLDMMSRTFVHFGLGKAFEDLGDYAEAMRHYEEGNRLRAMSARLDRPAWVARYDKIMTRFTADLLAHARQSLAKPATSGELPVFIVGIPRSGSTLVEQILSSHPAVAAGGELSFWQDRFKDWQPTSFGSIEAGALEKAASEFHTRLRAIGPRALRVTDKSLFNFELLWLLRLVHPEARIIHCRRSPIDNCLAVFFTNFSRRHDYAWDRGDLVFFYRQYERLMEHWRRLLSADRFTEVDYETLIAQPEAETRRLVDFCGLEWDEACLAPERNRRAVKTASLWQVRQPIYKTSVERWRRFEPWLGELRELLTEAEARAV